MSTIPRFSRALPLALLASLASPLAAQTPAAHVGQNVAQMKFGTIPGLPTCSQAAVQTGDPTKGPSILLAKLAPGCVFPWHWHTPNEHLILVSGAARVEPRSGPPLAMEPGAFARLDSRHIHRFTCTQTCLLYVYSDATFDMHYVDPAGKEIPPDAALQAVGETAAKPAI